MKPPPFEYQAPETLEEALELVSHHGYDGKIIAGGQSLVPMMNFRLVQPLVLIDLNRISELDFIIPTEKGGARVGAMTRQAKAEQDPGISERLPLLAETIPFIAHAQIRNRGTIGGSLAHADPASELPVVSLVMDARFRARSTTADRWLSAAEFFQGMFTTALNSDEILVEVEFPPLAPRTGWAFVEFSRRKGDYALVGLAALVTLDKDGGVSAARLIYLNVGDGPVEAQNAAANLIGGELEKAQIQESAKIAAQEEISPMGSVHTSIEYQQHLAQVLTVQAVERAYQRALQFLNA